MSDTAPDSRVGSRFGRYHLRRLLGRGGFGEVYEAEDTVMHRVVALKLMSAPYSRDPVFRERLQREAHTAGRLHEPHVVPIHFCGEIDGQLFVDMRLIKGTDLDTILSRFGPLRPPRAVAIVRQIASALDAAHADRVIHRDVKPANILVTADDFACLVDFGVASAASYSRLTSEGATIGTLAYMAPERLSASEAGYRGDIYALACVLYECLTGSPPYQDNDRVGLMASHLMAPIPRPSRQRPGIPAAFDRVVQCGMAKNPEHRYARAGDLALAAEHALTAPDQDQDTEILEDSGEVTLPEQPGRAIQPMADRTERLTRESGGAAQYPPQPAPPIQQPPPATRRRSRIRVLTVAAAAMITITTVAVVAYLVAGSSSRSGSSSQAGSPPPPSGPIELAFSGLDKPFAVAVDAAGAVYVTDNSNRMLKLAAGSTTATEVPALYGSLDVAADTAGAVYVISDYHVLKLPAGVSTPTEVPFTGLDTPISLTVDIDGNVYAIDTGDHTGKKKVLMWQQSSGLTTELAFTGLDHPADLAVDTVGSVYLTDSNRNRVLKLPKHATATELPFTNLDHPVGIAVDRAGGVYITDIDHNRVLKLPVGAATPIELPFTGLLLPYRLAVDPAGAVYVTDTKHNRVLKLPPA